MAIPGGSARVPLLADTPGCSTLGGGGSQSDLHCDPCDGGGQVGTCTLYYGGVNGVPVDVAVFAGRGGGRGFSVGVGRPGMCCAGSSATIPPPDPHA